MAAELTEEQRSSIDDAMGHFRRNRHKLKIVAQSLVVALTEDPELEGYVHFVKWRVKKEESLRAKLIRRISSGRVVGLGNLLADIGDLAGVRLIHLHAGQLVRMHPIILRILNEQQYELTGEPTAYCWDVEYQELFEGIGLRSEQKESMYTTVHYDVVSNKKAKIGCELQVRSLMDEVWGEVSHRVNYPVESPSETCRDQLKVLARLTSGCGRLVDSIFRSHNEAVG